MGDNKIEIRERIAPFLLVYKEINNYACDNK
jgi:hypothetical protein